MDTVQAAKAELNMAHHERLAERLRLDELKNGLDRHRDRIQTLDEQFKNLVERVTAQDANDAVSTSAVQGLQTQLTSMTAQIQGLRKECDCFCERDTDALQEIQVQLTRHEKATQGNTNSLQGIVAKLSQHEVDLKQNMDGLQAVKAELSTVHSERIGECSRLDKVQIGLDNHLERIKTLFKQSANLMDRATVQDSNIAEGANTLHELRTQFATVTAQVHSMEAEYNCIKSDLHQDMATQSSTLEELIGQFTQHVQGSANKHEKVVMQLSHHEAIIQQNTDTIEVAKEHLKAAQGERLAELRVVCTKLEHHEEQLISLPSHFKAQLSSAEEALVRALGDLSSHVRTTQVEMDKQLKSKAQLSDIHQVHAAMRTWVDEAQREYQATGKAFSRSLQQVSGSNSEQAAMLQRHEDWMNSTSAWLGEAEERERGFAHILYRMAEEDYPELKSQFHDIR
jgi:chromosome segregation ATPase